MDVIERIGNWFDVAVPNPTVRNGAVQLGCVFEEFGEFLGATDWGHSQLAIHLEEATRSQMEFDKEAQEGEANVDKILLADAAADIIVALVGYCRIHGIDIFGALKEVAQSNESKYYYVGVGDLSDHEWEDLNSICKEIESQGRYKGVGWERQGEWIVFKDENGKIMKNVRSYREPELVSFIGFIGDK